MLHYGRTVDQMTKIEEKRFSPPSPEVIYLPALFRRIENGDLRIPAFQRGLVWGEDRIIGLLESVFKGFPIGSLLIWKVDSPLLKIESRELSVFPTVEVRYPCNFILDGLQRTSVLYAVFHYQEELHDSMFDIIFDLDRNEFIIYSPEVIMDRAIRLRNIFTPKAFLAEQAKLSKQSDSDELMEKAILLHSTFQEYMIPIVTIAGRTTEDVVEVFEKINTTGLRLDAVDFIRATTWSEDFDLNKEIEVHFKHIFKSGFTIPYETISKVFSVIIGKEPTSKSMLELRNVDAATLSDGMRQTQQIISMVVDYLRQAFGIKSYDFVPYEGQLIGLAHFFNKNQNPNQESLDLMTKWFWAIGMNEELRGKPDHFVARMLSNIGRVALGDLDAIKPHIRINSRDIILRRMIRGKALSSAIALLFASNKARSILTGETIEPSEYLTEFSSQNYQPIIPTEILENLAKHPSSVLPNSIISSKLIANIIVVRPKESLLCELEGSMETYLTNKQLLTGDEFTNFSRSQFISDEIYDCLLRRDYASFLEKRANLMLDQIKLRINK